MKKRWFEKVFHIRDVRNPRHQLVDFCNRNNLQPGEVVVIHEESDQTWHISFMYYSEQERE